MKQRMVTNEEIGSLAAALAHLLHAGFGMGDALTLLKEDEQTADLRSLLEAMARDVDGGKPLAAAFRAAGSFPAYVSTLLEVGERAGKLEQTLEALGSYYRRRAQMERRLRTALQYPAALLAVLLAVTAVLLIWVLPVFDGVYARLGSSLTGVAGALLTLGGVLKQCLPVLLAVLVLLACAAAVPKLRQWALDFWRKHWGDKGVFGRINTARFLQALSLAVSSGMTAQEAAVLAASLARVPGFRKRCDGCLEQLDAGASLSQALRASALLPGTECRLLEAGERSGRSEQVLEDISRRLLEESEEALEREAGKAEPAMVAVACVIIGLVLLAVMLPLVDIMSAIG